MCCDSEFLDFCTGARGLHAQGGQARFDRASGDNTITDKLAESLLKQFHEAIESSQLEGGYRQLFRMLDRNNSGSVRRR